MSSTINATIQQNYVYPQQHSSIFKRFLAWSEAQQENRLLWLGIALAGHGCVLTPITLYFTFLSGMNFMLFMLALVAMTMALVVNLAALPTKITIPVLFFSVIIDIVVIAYAIGLSINS